MKPTAFVTLKTRARTTMGTKLFLVVSEMQKGNGKTDVSLNLSKDTMKRATQRRGAT